MLIGITWPLSFPVVIVFSFFLIIVLKIFKSQDNPLAC
ncbi:GhoT/OrtT family toxin [Dickeya ananatis]